MSAGYLVKCKCGVARCENWNEWLSAASSLSYPIGSFVGTDGHTYNRNGDFRCLVCSRYFKITTVKGKVKPDHKCDARCLASKGPSCECACGGKNHGGAYA